MKNKVLNSPKILVSRFENISKVIGDSLIKNRLRIVATFIVATIIVCCITISKVISNKREAEEVCVNRTCNIKDLIKVSAREYKRLDDIDRRYGYSNLENHYEIGSKGNRFIYDELGRRNYSKAFSIGDEKFNPNKSDPSKSKKYNDIVYVESEHPIFSYIKDDGFSVPNVKNGLIVDREKLIEAFKIKNKESYGENVAVLTFDYEDFFKFRDKISKARKDFVDKEFEKLIQEGEVKSKEELDLIKKSICTSGFNYDVGAIFNDDYYIICSKNTADIYTQSL